MKQKSVTQQEQAWLLGETRAHTIEETSQSTVREENEYRDGPQRYRECD